MHSVGRPLKLPSITNCLVSIILTKLVIAILVPKLVLMATTLKTFDLDYIFFGLLNPENPTLEITQCVDSYHTTNVMAHQRP